MVKKCEEKYDADNVANWKTFINRQVFEPQSSLNTNHNLKLTPTLSPPRVQPLTNPHPTLECSLELG